MIKFESNTQFHYLLLTLRLLFSGQQRASVSDSAQNVPGATKAVRARQRVALASLAERHLTRVRRPTARVRPHRKLSRLLHDVKAAAHDLTKLWKVPRQIVRLSFFSLHEPFYRFNEYDYQFYLIIEIISILIDITIDNYISR